MPDALSRAASFLGGEKIPFAEAHALWTALKQSDQISFARSVLERLRTQDCLTDAIPPQAEIRQMLCREQALLTSKDSELHATARHDRALDILAAGFDLQNPSCDAETLGIAGGICKRRWSDLGQQEDLVRSAAFYERGASGPLGNDAYVQINSAYIADVLAASGDSPQENRAKAKQLRQRIVDELPQTDAWWNVASRAEALFGLGRYAEATTVVSQARNKPAPWQLETTSRQLAHIAHLRELRPLEVPEIRAFFEALLPGASDAARSLIVGKVGLALSGGGFRASIFHLGVLARLAELNVLRHVDALSCVSGGSIVGACYWLMLRRRLLQKEPLKHQDYIALVGDLIGHFQQAVATNPRQYIQPGKLTIAWRFLCGRKGALNPEWVADVLAERFYKPLIGGVDPVYMSDLPFLPADHDAALAGSAQFNPRKHNWLRGHKVPALIVNATTVNTGHAWQFTPTWMGESTWAIHEAADSVPRLEWGYYDEAAGWRIELGRAVAASACVPFIFEPLQLQATHAYAGGIRVQLVDGGVYDNQGIVSLLASDCNVLLVSDASGQLLLETSPPPGLRGLLPYARRSMDTLMERVRLAGYADLAARVRSGLLRGLMFLHMKEGLDADVLRLENSQQSYSLQRAPLSPSGIRKDFQKAIAELRTDLNAFTADEMCALMACGYQMASKGLERDLAQFPELSDVPLKAGWVFDKMRAEITSVAPATPDRQRLLDALCAGSRVKL
jgi:predicted acylesterase/phospholipase RssA